ncbi:cytochrome P450 [Cokeromyces recurvatus]|uniref:cytochrome P450 n=1 Tax=Cokeromyces recurvatus TaxID=90255 RepID=UPI00221EED7B|nr:cytochrome P450 [Cokeromyces recurvatus]KAI7903596.1 cytochrome P450 [Cokeromyces recurvatus]
MSVDSIYRHTIVDKLVPILKAKGNRPYFISLAVVCVVVQQLYSFFVIPKYLRRFPNVSILSFAKSFYAKESVANRTKRLITPLTNAGHDFYVCKIPSTWTIYITNPIAAKQLLLKTDNFPKSIELFNMLDESNPFIQFLGTSNVAISNGEAWKNQRKIMNPAFHRAMPVEVFASIMPDLFKLIDQDSDNVPITNYMKSFTLDALGLSVFGFNFQSLKGDPEGWTKIYNLVVANLFSPWVNIFGKIDFLMKYVSSTRRKGIKATNTFNKMLENLAENRRQEIRNGKRVNIPENEKDLLTLMIEAEIQNNLEFSIKELRQNLALFFLAGHDTTANALTFCFYNLAKNKHVQRKLRKEILSILGDEPEDVNPTIEQLKQMSYLTMVIKENLRLSGPVDRLLSREALSDTNLAGTIMPKGTKIAIDIYAIHMNPKIWQNPESFIPERFEEGGEHESHVGLTWIPFSNGSRQCLGMNFSLVEQRTVLSMILKRYEVDISKDSVHYNNIVYDKSLNFAPQSLNLIFTKRY